MSLSCFPLRPQQGLVIVLLLALVSACSSTAPTQTAVNWQQHHDTVSALDSWQLQGRLNIRTDTESRTVNLLWTQQAGDFDINLSGSLGMGAVTIRGNETGLIMEKSSEAPYYADSLADISETYLGYAFPAEHLLHWVRGIMAPDTPYQAAWNERQLIEVLQQDQWQIEYDRYQQVAGLNLPGRIRMTHSPYRLTFLVNQWQLAPESSP